MSTQDALTTYICNDLLKHKDGLSLGADENLLLSGLVDSHSVMRLVAHIEKTYQISVSPADITLKNFKTVNAMAAFIEKKQS